MQNADDVYVIEHWAALHHDGHKYSMLRGRLLPLVARNVVLVAAQPAQRRRVNFVFVQLDLYAEK